MIYRLRPGFYRNLRAIDPYLDARFDAHQVAILVFSRRPGKPLVHEFTQPLKFTTKGGLEIELNINDLEDYTIKRLKENDVWQRFGTGKALDDHLAKQEEDATARKKKNFLSERKAMFKDQRRYIEAAFENARNGRFNKETVLPYKTPEITVGIDLKKEEPKEVSHAVTELPR